MFFNDEKSTFCDEKCVFYMRYILYSGKEVIKMNKYYALNNNEMATANKMMDNSSVENLWSGFTLKKGKLKITPTDAFVFSVASY